MNNPIDIIDEVDETDEMGEYNIEYYTSDYYNDNDDNDDIDDIDDTDSSPSLENNSDNQGISEEITTGLAEGITAELNRFNNILSRYSTIFREVDSSNNIHPLPQEETQQTNDFNLNTSTTNTLTRLLHSSFYDKPKYKQILSEKGEEELEELDYNSNLDTNTICPIFQIEFTDGMKVIKLPCNHIFSPDAIKKWLKEERAECPVCRHTLDSKEIEDESYAQTMAIINRRSRRNAIYPGSSRAPRRDSIITSLNPLVNTVLPQPLTSPLLPIVTTYLSSDPIDILDTLDVSANYSTNSYDTIRRRITTNFLADIVSEVINTQQEEELQQAILNSLQPPSETDN